MNKRNLHIHTLLILAGLTSALSGCQNRKSGMFGSDNWGRNGFANAFLNQGINPNSLGEGRAIGYIVYNQAGNLGLPGQNQAVPYNNQAGGVQASTNPNGPNTGSGGIAGGSSIASQQTPCMLKIVSGSMQTAYAGGSNQSFAGMYHETISPTSGAPFYAVGAKQEITCGRDSEVAATTGAFYVTGGSGNNNVWVYRMNNLGMPLGASPPLAINSPTKIAASSSGHIAVISCNAGKGSPRCDGGGDALVLLQEGRVGGDGGWLADIIRTIPSQNNAVFTDVVFDRVQGAIYVGQKLPGGAGRILVLDIATAYNGAYGRGITFANGVSDTAFDSWNPREMYNFSHNLPNETSVDHLFRQSIPLKMKNNNGLTGILTTQNHPFFMETGLGLRPEDTAGKSTEDINQAYLNNAGMKVVDINVNDPFQNASHSNSSYVQQGFKYKDFAVGNDIAYLITESGSLYTIYVKPGSFDASTPVETRLPLGRLNTIEMDETQKIAVVTGTTGLSIGRVAGNNIIFASTGRPDISEVGEVLHAAVLEKVIRDQPVAQPAPANATASAALAK